jgi:hypothetical protein
MLVAPAVMDTGAAAKNKREVFESWPKTRKRKWAISETDKYRHTIPRQPYHLIFVSDVVSPTKGLVNVNSGAT